MLVDCLTKAITEVYEYRKMNKTKGREYGFSFIWHEWECVRSSDGVNGDVYDLNMREDDLGWYSVIVI